MESRSFALQRWSYTYSQEKVHYFLSLYFNIFINSCIFFHYSTDSFTNLHIPQPLMENAENVDCDGENNTKVRGKLL